jgi:hypothetical protein
MVDLAPSRPAVSERAFSESAQSASADSARGEHDARVVERLLFWGAVVVLTASLWIAPRLPMADLPQHAGQVALWRDLILGQSAFADDLRVNLVTPYLIGYGLALPLSFVMDAGEALRIVMAGAFLCWVAAARGLRRELDGDPRLDWLTLCGFFGFAFGWGFYTFLTAAPLALVAIRLAARFDALPSWRRGAAFCAVGAALLFAHGLQFLFVLAASGAITLEASWRAFRAQGARAAIERALRRAGPPIALFLAFLAFMLARRFVLGPEPSTPVQFGTPIYLRAPESLLNVWDMGGPPITTALMGAVLAALRVGGWRFRTGPGLALLLLAAAMQLFCVSYAVGTGFIYERFALYLMPFAGLALAPGPVAPRAASAARLILVGAVLGSIASHVERLSAFAKEEAQFAPVLAQARRGERVANLNFDVTSATYARRAVFMHWPVWMQARAGSFVDFNFAFFHPQIVRFRDDRRPYLLEDQSYSPEAFEWTTWRGERYGAFVLRGDDARHADFLARVARQAPCPLTTVVRSGPWGLYRPAADCEAKGSSQTN